jgi:HlyD family secretion protein
LWRRERQPIAYTVAPVDFGTLDEVVSATGLVQPQDVFLVGSETAGKVVAVLADFNQVVEEGEVLLRLDDRLAKMRLQQAEIAVKLAQSAAQQAEIERDTAARAVQHLRGLSDAVRGKTELDIAEGKLRAAEAAVTTARLKGEQAENARRQAELALQLTTVRAPVLEIRSVPAPSLMKHPGTGVVAEEAALAHPRHSFVVLERKVSVNQQIGPSLQGHLFTLAASLEHMRVMVQVGEGDIDKVRRGMAARLTLAGGSDDSHPYSGTVEDIHLVPANEQGAVYYKVFLNVANERDSENGDWKLRPGQTASVDIIRRSHRSVWKLPTAALQFEPAADQQTEAARARLARRQNLKHPKQWQTVWTVGADGKPWPIFVRTGGTNDHGEAGIQDGQFTEVLEWDPEREPSPDPSRPEALRVITAAPPPQTLFSIPKIKY